MNTELEDLTIVDGIKLIVGKKYLIKYSHCESDWKEVEITRTTDMGHAWGIGDGTNGIITNGSYLVQTIPYASYNLSVALNDLQDHTIGLFLLRGCTDVELVVKKDGDLLKTISIGTLAGLRTTHVPMDKGIYKEFGQGRNLSDMKNNPFELDEFYKSFVKK